MQAGEYVHGGVRDDLQTMTDAGYSGTPLARKLGAKPGFGYRIVCAPTMPDRPDALVAVREVPVLLEAAGAFAVASELSDLVCWFVVERSELEAEIATVGALIKPNGSLWLFWPKKAARIATGITEDTLREVILPLGLVDNKVCAVDAVWSGLRFVWRLTHR